MQRDDSEGWVKELVYLLEKDVANYGKDQAVGIIVTIGFNMSLSD